MAKNDEPSTETVASFLVTKVALEENGRSVIRRFQGDDPQVFCVIVVIGREPVEAFSAWIDEQENRGRISTAKTQ